METIVSLSGLRQSDLTLAGGKASNLGELIAGGFPVPPGFCILTPVYWEYINYNHLQDTILSLVKTVDLNNPGSAESASLAIRTLFERSVPPLELADDIIQAYHGLGEATPVAVRSSATAEDLPDLSFAGQQDTFLNIVGEEQLLQAVRQAWSSLWTSRAIVYRLKNDVSHEDVALAVIVQEMVPSEASGVLFTANPLTGRRGEIVINAVFGLGEALVSGQVAPDQYVVEATGAHIQKSLGEKALASRPIESGGVQLQKESASQDQAIPDEVILELVQLARKLEAHFKTPQDAEWAWAGKKLHIVQSRSITSLYPLPEGVPTEPLAVFVSFAAVQGFMEPMTPVGRDMIKLLFCGLGPLTGRKFTIEKQPVFFTAGERLFMNITGLLRNKVGRRLAQRVLGVVEPGIQQAVRSILDEPALAPENQTIKPSSALTLARLMLPVVVRIPVNLIAPQAARIRASRRMNNLLLEINRRSEAAHTLSDWLDLSNTIALALTRTMIFHVIPKFGPAVGMLYLLNHLGAEVPDGKKLALEITRGLPHNVTTEMDLELWKTAQVIHRDPASMSLFSAWEARSLAEAFRHTQLPSVSQAALQDFLERYGFRGPGEFDIGRLRWQDEPEPLIQALQSYLSIQNPAQAPDAVFSKGEQRAIEAIHELATRVRQQPGGFLKAHISRFAASRVRALAGLRELPKFIAVHTFNILRKGLLKAAEGMVSVHIISRADDIFYLHMKELRQISALQNPDSTWPEDACRTEVAKDIYARIEERRQRAARELSRRQIPRLLLSDGRAFYEGVDGEESVQHLRGDPVSPGMIEGLVRVVLDPRKAELQPGEILVCPGTDPSWTPLFLSAVGLVMEVGGLMTHGSVVAREYGIPAVVGVTQATQTLKTGQKIRLDGSTGRIDLL